MKKFLITSILVAIAIAIVSASVHHISFNLVNASSNASQTTPQPLVSNTITIPVGAQNPSNGIFYEPPDALVSDGANVIWHNEDSVQHTATADNGSFDTGFIKPGQSASVTVRGSGVIPYHCNIHPWMHGKITISSG